MASAACALVLLAVDIGAGYFVVLSWLTAPSDNPLDPEHARETIGLAAIFGTFFAFVGLLLPMVPVALRWLRWWWFLPPAILFLAGITRLFLGY